MTDTTIFVYTINQGGKAGAWSRYLFPFAVDHFAHKDGDLYIRSGDDVLRVVEDTLVDYGNDAREVGFEGVVQWPFLDLGSPGVNKILHGFDIVGTGEATVQVGFDQRNLLAITDGVTVPEDTVPSEVIPLSVCAPSLSIKLTYAAGQAWQFNAMNLYFTDTRATS